MEKKIEFKKPGLRSEGSSKFNVIKMERKRLKEEYERITALDSDKKCDHLSDVLRKSYDKLNSQYENFERDTNAILDIEDKFGHACSVVETLRYKLLKSIMKDNGHIDEYGKFKEDAMRELVEKMGLVDNKGKIKKKEMLAINNRFYDRLDDIRGIFLGKLNEDIMQQMRPNQDYDTIENNAYYLMETTLKHKVDAVLMHLPNTQVNKDLWHDHIIKEVEHRDISRKINNYKNKYTSYILNVIAYNLFLDSFNRIYGNEKSKSLDVSKIKTFIDIDNEKYY